MKDNRNEELKRLTDDGLMGKVEKVYMTPAMAQDWLSRNRINRKIRERRVQYWITVLLSGNWVPASCLFHVDQHHNLINGQHRLTAIVRSGVAVWIWVLKDCGSRVFNAIDIGAASRQGRDMIPEDQKNRGAVSSIITNLHKIENGSYDMNAPNPYRLDSMFQEYRRDIEWGIEMMSSKRGRLYCPAHVVAAIVYCRSIRTLRPDVDEFAKKLVEAVGRGDNCPTAALERIIRYDHDHKRTGNTVLRWLMTMKTFQALRSYCEKAPFTKFQENRDGLEWAWAKAKHTPPIPEAIFRGEVLPLQAPPEAGRAVVSEKDSASA